MQRFKPLPRWQHPIYRVSVWLQWALWEIGRPVHNKLFSWDECTPDFNCCTDLLKKN